jgi:hypothetical protein
MPGGGMRTRREFIGGHAGHPRDVQRLVEAFGSRRCYWGTDITNSFAKATWRQRIAQFGELPFLTEEDKDWILGRAIRARLGWA